MVSLTPAGAQSRVPRISYIRTPEGRHLDSHAAVATDKENERVTSDIVVGGVRHRFGDVLALEETDLTIPAHERLAIVGPSGCGKSTLLFAIAGLLEPTEGSIQIGADRTARGRLRHCALMPQKDLLLPWRTALDNAALALENRGVSKQAARSRTQPLFKRFGLGEFERHSPAQLSGGMRQRVAFLRTLMADKEILLLDEPFAALDSITRAQMQEWLLGALGSVPRTVVLVTHDVDEALLLTHKVIVLSARPGRIMVTLDNNFPTNVPRREIVTSPEFVNLKQQALEALEC
jgi:NitT/TauT family transport system ATP-binding protein